MTCLPADSWSHRGVLGWQRAITGSELATVASASLSLQALLSQLHTTVQASSREEEIQHNCCEVFGETMVGKEKLSRQYLSRG